MEADKVVIGVEWGYSLDAYMLGDDRKEDEELRVCYVGVTRCKNNLYLYELPGEYKKPFPLLQNYVREWSTFIFVKVRKRNMGRQLSRI